MVGTNDLTILSKVVRFGDNPLLIGDMVGTLEYIWSPVTTPTRDNPLLIGDMVGTALEDEVEVLSTTGDNPLLIGDMVGTFFLYPLCPISNR